MDQKLRSLMKKQEEEDAKFEDNDYLSKYFREMRGQIEHDLSNID